MGVSLAVFKDMDNLMAKLLDYEGIIVKWKEQHPEYDANIDVLIGETIFTIRVVTKLKGSAKESREDNRGLSD